MTSVTGNIDFAKILKKALSRGGSFAEVYIEDTSSTSITLEEDRIEKVVTGRDRGAGVRVIADFKTYYAYTNDLSDSSLLDVASTLAAAVGDGAPVAAMDMRKVRLAPGFGIKSPAEDETLEKKIRLVNLGNKVARGFDKRIKQVKVVYGDGVKKVVVANSLGDHVEENRSSILYLCQAVAEEGGVIQTGYEPVGGVAGFEIFEETPPEKVAEVAARRAVMMLGAKKAPGGKMPVVLSFEAGGTMIHEAVGHGLEADLAQERLSVYSGKVGEKVASSLITVIDDGTIPFKRGSGFFDGEGSPTKRTVLVENGVLKTYMYDRLTAMKDNVESTGNGRRESYHHRPIVRMTNTMIAPGKDDPAAILKSVDKGLFVKKMGGGQVNTVNGDFVFEVTEGYLIENGVVGELVRGATLTGNGPEVLKNIDMVGNDLGFGIGTCGKDGQGVPVADAQPTLRIPDITVGGAVGKE
ncbi:MAG: TldD/PmbA family protein [Deltaproteobacteria bacterium]|nr:TldD/PmbA family protein [Deltaproteobacteria bacterium]